MIAGLIYAVFGFIEMLVGLRFVLLLLGANPASAFVAWIYQWSGPFVAPFNGIFGAHNVTAGPGVVTHSVFDWSSLIALIIYGAVVALISRIFVHVAYP
jgi:YggT family protein